jgi:gliding motility-associated-like protein
MRYFIGFILSLLTSLTDAQSGEWTWMHGSNFPGDPGLSAPIGITASYNDPPALYESCNWTDNNGDFWIFGGVLSNYSVNSAFWKFSPSTNMWTWMKGSSYSNQNGVYGTMGIPAPGNCPGARGWGAITWTDLDGNLWLFGGNGYDAVGSQGDLSDLWKYDVPANMWTWMKGPNTISHQGYFGTKGVASSLNLPRSRQETSASWTDNDGNLWMFGGNADSTFLFGFLNDLWKYDPLSNNWTWMKGSDSLYAIGSRGLQGVPSPGNEPSGRDVYSTWKDSKGNLWLFGGNTYGGVFNDLWKYDISANMWCWIRGDTTSLTTPEIYCQPLSSGKNPDPRSESRACWTDSCGNFWLFGGGGNSVGLNDLWQYNVEHDTWTLINGHYLTSDSGAYGSILIPGLNNRPIDRAGSSSFKDKQGNLWIFGGSNYYIYNDLWRFKPDKHCGVNSCDSHPVTAPIIPNIFTPNGDGNNDLFLIIAEECKVFQLHIYDRWGTQVFSSVDKTVSWNGNVNNSGNEAVEGVYYYVLNITDLKSRNQSYKGFLTLMRN